MEGTHELHLASLQIVWAQHNWDRWLDWVPSISALSSSYIPRRGWAQHNGDRCPCSLIECLHSIFAPSSSYIPRRGWAQHNGDRCPCSLIECLHSISALTSSYIPRRGWAQHNGDRYPYCNIPIFNYSWQISLQKILLAIKNVL